MFDDDQIERHFREAGQMIRSAEHKFWTAFKWVGAVVAFLVLAALFVAWRIWGS